MAKDNEKPVRSGTCSMTITITDASGEPFEYTVRPHRWNGAGKAYRLIKVLKEGQTADRDGAVYITGVAEDYHCNCPDQTNKRNQDGCKHIKALCALWLL